MVQWSRAFEESDFTVCEHPTVLVKHVAGLQKHRIKHFPQCNSELVMVIRRNGSSPTVFQPDFTTEISFLPDCSFKHFSSMVNVQICSSFLYRQGSKSPFKPNEKHPDIMCHLIQRYSPFGGTVMDPWAGPMTVGLSCITTGRKCHLIEENHEIYSAAVHRLRLNAEILLHTSTPTQDPSSQILTRTEDSYEHTPSKKMKLSNNGTDTGSVVRELHSGSFTRNCAVTFFLGVSEVGTAELVSSNPSGPFTRVIHGTDLSTHGSENEDLVVVTKVVVKESFNSLNFPFFIPGVEEPPSIMSECLNNGVYIWDLNQLR